MLVLQKLLTKIKIHGLKKLILNFMNFILIIMTLMIIMNINEKLYIISTIPSPVQIMMLPFYLQPPLK